MSGNLFRCLMVGIVCSMGSIAIAEDSLSPPLRLTADGEAIDAMDRHGHAGPCFEDLNGDDLPDLLLGDFGGKFRIFLNHGTAKRPLWKKTGLLQAGDSDAQVNIYCCVANQPRFCDLDADGVRDMISSSYDPGYCYLFRRVADGGFEEGQILNDQSDTPVRSAPKQKENFQSFGSFYTPVDWDADGDLDLLIGCSNGTLLLRLNEGTPERHRFAKENRDVKTIDGPLKVKGHLCPVAADWDADGLWDILAGSKDGSVAWFKNIGTPASPKFDTGQQLVAGPRDNGYARPIADDSEIEPGVYVQIDIVDYNLDGKLDLIVGDFQTHLSLKSNLDEEQLALVQNTIAEDKELLSRYTVEFEKLQADFRERYPGDSVYGEEATAEWGVAMEALGKTGILKAIDSNEEIYTSKLRPYLKSFKHGGDRRHYLETSHGYVWLFLRK